MFHLTRKDLEELKPSIDKIVHKLLGTSDLTLINSIEKLLYFGYDKRKITDKIVNAHLDRKKACKITEKIFDLVNNYTSRSRKRNYNEMSDKDRETRRSKTKNMLDDKESELSSPDLKSSKFSSTDIEKMMANAKSEIEERKRNLDVFKVPASPAVPAAKVYGIPVPVSTINSKKLVSKVKAKITSALAANNNSSAYSGIPDKPTPLILDAEGRTIDKSGKAVQLTHVAPTLKANIRAKKREEFKTQMNKKGSGELSETKYFDPRLGVKSTIRTKRALKFNEPGKFQQLAERLRMRAQLEKLQNEISQIAKKTGISSATKLALIAKNEGHSDDVPDMEWWDSVILVDTLNTMNGNKIAIKKAVIGNLVEHPTQIRPPTESLRPVYMPVFLTKKERKKLRRQTRREMWKEEQEKIRLGLETAPESKLRITNLMNILGAESVQDPTKIEAHVRAQMAKRQRAHEEANAARQLTTEQKREKKIKKIKEDTTLGVHVSVYRIKDLHNNASKKFKVEANAKQLYMTGCVMLYPDCCVIVVEGGIKQQKKYKRLMMHRIKWEEDMVKDPDGKEVPNKCALVWEGTNKQRNFGEIKFKVCSTEKLAREHFRKHKVEHYWDLAYSGAVLEQTNDL